MIAQRREAIARIADHAVSLGLWALLFLAPLKWGLPILESGINSVPTCLAEWVGASWPYEIFIFAIAYLFFLHCAGVLIRGEAFNAGPWFIFIGPLLFLGVAAISGHFSVDRNLSLPYVMAYGAYVLLFFLILWRPDRHRFLLSALLVSTGIVVVYAIYQRFVGFGQTARWASLYMAGNPHMEIIQAKLASGRVFGTMVYPNSLGGYLAMTIPILGVWCWSGVSKHAYSSWIRMAFPVTGIFALLLSGSQGSFAALGVVGLGVGAVVISRKIGSRGWWWASTFFLTGLALVAFFTNLFPHFTKWVTLVMRWTYWVAALKMGCSQGWLGYGPGSFGVVYPQFMLPWGGQTQLAHSHILQIVAEMGWVGAFGWSVWWFGWMVLPGRMNDREDGLIAWGIQAGLLAFLLHGFVDFDFFIPGITLQAVFLCAIVWSWQCPKKRQDTASARPRE